MNKNQEYQQLVKTAKEMGIDTKGMKKADLLQAIEDKTGNTPVEPDVKGEESNATTPGQTEAKNPIGRPVDPTSVRQQKLAAMKERAAANGGVVKLGRPVVEGSERQKRLAELEAKRAAGTCLRGRPKKVKEETVEAPVVEVKVEAPQSAPIETEVKVEA